MATVKEFLTKFGFQVDEDPLKRLDSHLEGIKRRLEFLTSTEIIRGLIEMGEKWGNFAEEMHAAATSAGLTVEELQKLQFAGKEAAVSADEVTGSLARLTRHLAEAKRGDNSSLEVFARAGISAEQIQGFRTSKDAMMALADSFSRIQDPIRKQALAQELLGRGSFNMVAFLSKGSGAIHEMGIEADKLGIIISHKQIENLSNLEHAFSRVWLVVRSVTAAFAASLAPAMTSIIDITLKYFEVNKGFTEKGIEKFGLAFSGALGFVYGSIERIIRITREWIISHQPLVDKIMEIAKVFGSVETPGILTVAGAAIAVKGLKEIKEVAETVKEAGTLGVILWSLKEIWKAFNGEETDTERFLKHVGYWEKISQSTQEAFANIEGYYNYLRKIAHLDFSSSVEEEQNKSLGAHGLQSVVDETKRNRLQSKLAEIDDMLEHFPGNRGLLDKRDEVLKELSPTINNHIQIVVKKEEEGIGKAITKTLKETLGPTFRDAWKDSRPVYR